MIPDHMTSYGILGQVRYLIASIPDICTLTYFSKGAVSSGYKVLVMETIKVNGRKQVSE